MHLRGLPSTPVIDLTRPAVTTPRTQIAGRQTSQMHLSSSAATGALVKQVMKDGSQGEQFALMTGYVHAVLENQEEMHQLYYELGKAKEAARRADKDAKQQAAKKTAAKQKAATEKAAKQEAAKHWKIHGVLLSISSMLLCCVVCLGTIVGMSVLNSYCGDEDLGKCALTLPWSEFARDFWSAVVCLTALYRNDEENWPSWALSALAALLYLFRSKKLWAVALLAVAASWVPDTVLNAASQGSVNEGEFRPPQWVDHLGVQLAAAAYAKDKKELDGLLAAVSMRRLAFHQQPPTSNIMEIPQYFVAEQASKTKVSPGALWVAFRGTGSASDALLNLFSLLDFKEAAMTGCQMHGGYLQAVDSLKHLHRTLDSERHVGKDVYLVGHSLGGGLALAYSGAGLLPTRRKCSDTSKCRKPKHKVLTYGAPNIFANDYCNNRTSAGTSVSQYVHAADPVPRLLGANSAKTLKKVLQLLELNTSLVDKVADKLDTYRVAKHARHLYLNGSTGVLEIATDGVNKLLDLRRAMKMTAVADHTVNAYVRGLRVGSA